MLVAVRSSWALFLGLAFIMLGNGLQGSLLGIRATLEGFSTSITGLVMSGYFAGFLVGSYLTPRMVTAVGHVRVFAAMASLASTAVLVHVVFLDPYTWVAMRVLTGFSFAGLYVVAESWLNAGATNESRGQLLAFYMVVVLGGMGSGQILLNLDDPGGYSLFILSSVLISLALVPILLSAIQAPAFEAPSTVSLLQLYRMSPLGVVASFGTGMAHGAIFGMGAVYAESIGMSVKGISYFMGMVFAGGVFFQWPVGMLSDHFDRRKILTLVTFAAALMAVGEALTGAQSQFLIFGFIGLFGAMCVPLYSLCVAHTNDHLAPEQMVAASATLYIYVGLGAAVSPLLSATLMEEFGPAAFFYYLAAVHCGIGVFALFRMTRREAVPLDEQGPSLPVASSATPVATVLSAEEAVELMEEAAEEA